MRFADIFEKGSHAATSFMFPRWLDEKISTEERRKRIYAFVTMVAGSPILAFFGITFYLQGDCGFACFLNLFVALLFVGALWILPRLEKTDWLFRLVVSGVALLFLFNTLTGEGNGASLFWLFTYPLAVFSLFGRNEGLIWVLAMVPAFIGAVWCAVSWGLFAYSWDVLVRFSIALLIVSIMSYAMEALRHLFAKRIEEKNAELECAMESIKTLEGLLPICSMCRRVRDDQGYWSSIENYVHSHTNTKFSHGICNACLKEFDEGLYNEMKEAGDIRDSLGPPPTIPPDNSENK